MDELQTSLHNFSYIRKNSKIDPKIIKDIKRLDSILKNPYLSNETKEGLQQDLNQLYCELERQKRYYG